ncbi:hypothetical protein [Kitasatospora sp. NPDC050463]
MLFLFLFLFLFLLPRPAAGRRRLCGQWPAETAARLTVRRDPGQG